MDPCRTAPNRERPGPWGETNEGLLGLQPGASRARGPVGRAIIHDDSFEIGVVLAADARDRALEKRLAVVHGRDHLTFAIAGSRLGRHRPQIFGGDPLARELRGPLEPSGPAASSALSIAWARVT